MEALGDLSQNHAAAKAGTHKVAVLNFSFIISLVAAKHALSSLVPLPLLLQKKECNLLEAVSETEFVSRVLIHERNDPAVWEELFNQAAAIGKTVGVEPSRPRGAA